MNSFFNQLCNDDGYELTLVIKGGCCCNETVTGDVITPFNVIGYEKYYLDSEADTKELFKKLKETAKEYLEEKRNETNMSVMNALGFKDRIVIGIDSMVNSLSPNGLRVKECTGEYKKFHLPEYKLYFTCVGSLRANDGRWWYELISEFTTNNKTSIQDILDFITYKIPVSDKSSMEIHAFDYSNADNIKLYKISPSQKNSTVIEPTNGDGFCFIAGKTSLCNSFYHSCKPTNCRSIEYLESMVCACLKYSINAEKSIRNYDNGMLGFTGICCDGPINIAIIENGILTEKTIEV